MMLNVSQIKAIARKYSQFRTNLEELARHLGADVIYTDLIDVGTEIDGFTVPYIAPNGKQGWLIVINGCNSEERQRYTFAHELGHLVLKHHGFVMGFELSTDLGLQERHANIFAAELLMPTPELKKCIAQGMSFEEMLEFFKVSFQALAFQLKEIGREDIICY